MPVRISAYLLYMPRLFDVELCVKFGMIPPLENSIKSMPQRSHTHPIGTALKYGVRISQVMPSNCFRRLKKIVLPSIFDTSLSLLMM